MKRKLVSLMVEPEDLELLRTECKTKYLQDKFFHRDDALVIPDRIMFKSLVRYYLQ